MKTTLLDIAIITLLLGGKLHINEMYSKKKLRSKWKEIVEKISFEDNPVQMKITFR